MNGVGVQGHIMDGEGDRAHVLVAQNALLRRPLEKEEAVRSSTCVYNLKSSARTWKPAIMESLISLRYCTPFVESRSRLGPVQRFTLARKHEERKRTSSLRSEAPDLARFVRIPLVLLGEYLGARLRIIARTNVA